METRRRRRNEDRHRPGRRRRQGAGPHRRAQGPAGARHRPGHGGRHQHRRPGRRPLPAARRHPGRRGIRPGLREFQPLPPPGAAAFQLGNDLGKTHPGLFARYFRRPSASRTSSGRSFAPPPTSAAAARSCSPRGSLLQAVRASISVPVIFKPVRLRASYLVDGGLLNPVPVDVLKKNGSDFTIAVNVITPRPLRPRRRRKASVREKLLLARLDDFLSRKLISGRPGKEPNMIEAFLSTMEIMQQKLIAARLRNDAPDVIIHVRNPRFQVFRVLPPGRDHPPRRGGRAPRDRGPAEKLARARTAEARAKAENGRLQLRKMRQRLPPRPRPADPRRREEDRRLSGASAKRNSWSGYLVRIPAKGGNRPRLFPGPGQDQGRRVSWPRPGPWSPIITTRRTGAAFF